MKTVLDRLAVLLSTAFGIGYAPKAPGTFGSIPGLALGVALALHAGLWAKILILVALIALSLWAIARAEEVLLTHDDQRIVIDEVAGQALAAAFLAPGWVSALLAFGLFRLLDITKPLLIGRIDRDAPGALGTLGDDLLAGAVAGAVLWPFFS